MGVGGACYDSELLPFSKPKKVVRLRGGSRHFPHNDYLFFRQMPANTLKDFPLPPRAARQNASVSLVAWHFCRASG